ncbi:MAG TPA: glycosyltransferase family 39 protein, partial [Thermoanaerobaculia bacterium]
EAAYVLQARIFAAGRWADPPPPRAEFFEQAHVLVEPRRAAKYPPGHSLALAPGAAADLPAAVPVLLAGMTGALLYARTRRLAGPIAGILTWTVWVASPLGLRYRSSFFSEVTTGLLFLLVWTGVSRWRERGRTAWLVLAGAAAGFGAITRPLTMLLLVIPFAIVVLRDAVRRRAWLAIGIAAFAGILPSLILLPLWNARTTGDARTSPVELYTRQYLPFDVPGLGLRADAPTRALPEDLRRLSSTFASVHRLHVWERLPGILRDRVTEWLRAGCGAGIVLLLPIAVAGLFVLPREGWLAVSAGALLLVGYLAYAHLAHWSVYYFEALVPLTLAAGVGLAAVLAGLPRRFGAFGLVLSLLGFAILIARGMTTERSIKRSQEAPFRLLEERLETLPEQPAIVFVRYAEGHNPALSLIRNGPDISRQLTWIVYDRGAENARLRAVEPSRAAYLYDEGTGVLAPLDPAPSSRPAPPL